MTKKPESKALEQASTGLQAIIDELGVLKPRLCAIAGDLAGAEAQAVVIETADDGTTYTVERWVSEALTSTLGGSVREALDDVLDRLAYLQDFDAVRQDIHDFQ